MKNTNMTEIKMDQLEKVAGGIESCDPPMAENGRIGTGPLGTGPLTTGPLGTGPLDETGPLGTGPLTTGPLVSEADIPPRAEPVDKVVEYPYMTSRFIGYPYRASRFMTGPLTGRV